MCTADTGGSGIFSNIRGDFMKCSSCGREFDEEKYYRICPKCGTYNNVKRQEFYFEQQPYTGTQERAGMETQAPDGAYDSAPQEDDGRYTAPGTRKSSLKGLAIALVILVIIGAVEFIISMIMVLGEDSVKPGIGDDLSSYLIEEMEETGVSFGEAFVLEENTGLSMQIDGVEVVCEADTFADFPQGQKLAGIKLSSTGAEVSYDTFEESPLGRIYVGYDQTFKEVLEGDSFKAYRSVIGDRADFSLWDVKYGEAESGYVYVFLPADVTEGVVYVEMREPSNGQLRGIYAVKFALGEVQ